MAQFPIEILATDESKVDDFLADRLYEFNVEATGMSDGELLIATVRDDDGAIIAGLSGHSWGGCCEIKHVWVHERLRGSGLGTELMKSAEQEAIRRGCGQIVLSTHSFQAPEFYERLGYQRLGAVPDYPEGYENILYIRHLRTDGRRHG